MLNRNIQLVATILYSADKEYFHHHRKFYWVALTKILWPHYTSITENEAKRKNRKLPFALNSSYYILTEIILVQKHLFNSQMLGAS